MSRVRAALGRLLGRVGPHGRSTLARARSELSTPRRRALAGAVVLGAVLLVAVVTTRDDEPQSASPGAPAEAERAGSGLSAEVGGLLEELSARRKVAQLMLVGFEGAGSDDPVLSTLEELDYAGVVITDRNYESVDQVEQLIDAAGATTDDAGDMKPWIVAPQEGGEFNAIPDLPPDKAPAELATPREAAEVAASAAEALDELGMTGVLAPVVDVGSESGGAFVGRLYSDSPRRVRAYALATLEAYTDAGLFAAPKHFPGLGAASQSPELGPANVGLSIDQLAARDLIPFEAAIEAGAPGIVVGHGLYGVDDFVTPASMSKTIVTDLLRSKLDFDGVAIADDVTAPAITAVFEPPNAAVDAVRAGIDLVYVSRDDAQQRAVFDALLEAVRTDRITAERLDEAVGRTLAAKQEAGLLGRPGGAGGDRSGSGRDRSGSG